jgi:hypothetical protein
MNQIPDNVVEMYRTIFPNISDKDIAAFIYSKPEIEPYELSEDPRKREGVPEGTVAEYHLSDSVAFTDQMYLEK